jgi:hypothetical protein
MKISMEKQSLFLIGTASLLLLLACDPVYRKHFPVKETHDDGRPNTLLSLSGKDYDKVYALAISLAKRRGMVHYDPKNNCKDESKLGCEFDTYRYPGRSRGFKLLLTKKHREDKGLRIILLDFPSWEQSAESKAFEKELLDSLSKN